jgi:capsular polysaccharide transport system permease protein
MQGDTSFIKSLSIQGRVIGALLMREIHTRYGRHNIGFFWLFIEPMLFCNGIIIIRKYLVHELARGLPVIAFVLTGYSTILLWRNCGSRCSCAVSVNFALLYHHNVRVVDIVISRLLLEITGCAIGFILTVTAYTAAGFLDPPEDWKLVMAGYLLEAMVAISIGFLVGALTELSEVFERLWHPMMYFMLPISGFGFMVDWLPIKIQKLAVLIPMVNALEMIRQGFFGSKVRCHYSLFNLAVFYISFVLSGLILLKVYERRMEPPA